MVLKSQHLEYDNGAEQFFNAQAVLFLCMTCNLNLLCKDGYIISLALFGDK